jgi:transposase
MGKATKSEQPRLRKKPSKKPTPRQPGSGNGKDRRTAAQLDRQEKVFDRNVMFGRTIRQLAAEFGISPETVISDLRHEEQRRSKENAARRSADLARSLSFYDGVIAIAQEKSKLYDTLLGERDGAKISDHTLDAMLKARERQDKLLGLEAPTKVDLGIQALLAAIGGGDELPAADA